MTEDVRPLVFIYEKVDGRWSEWRRFWNTYTAVMLWCRATGSMDVFLAILDDVRHGSMFERASLADGRPLLIGLSSEVLTELGLRH